MFNFQYDMKLGLYVSNVKYCIYKPKKHIFISILLKVFIETIILTAAVTMYVLHLSV